VINLSWSELETVEQGYDLLTLRQAEKLATLYGRPLATLFLSEPPAEEPQDTQFRRLPGAPAPPWPAAMRLLARRIRERQDSAIELYDALDEEPPWTTRAKDFVARDRASFRVSHGKSSASGETNRPAGPRSTHRCEGRSFSGIPTRHWDRTMPGICKHLEAPCCTLPEALAMLGARRSEESARRSSAGWGHTHPREGSNVMREVPRNTTGASMLNPEVGVELRRLTKAPRRSGAVRGDIDTCQHLRSCGPDGSTRLSSQSSPPRICPCGRGTSSNWPTDSTEIRLLPRQSETAFAPSRARGWHDRAPSRTARTDSVAFACNNDRSGPWPVSG
jgi:hypothetical protein